MVAIIQRWRKKYLMVDKLIFNYYGQMITYLFTEYISFQENCSELVPNVNQFDGWRLFRIPDKSSLYRRSKVARGSSVKFSILMCLSLSIPIPFFIGSGIFCTNHFNMVHTLFSVVSFFALSNYYYLIFSFIFMKIAQQIHSLN